MQLKIRRSDPLVCGLYPVFPVGCVKTGLCEIELCETLPLRTEEGLLLLSGKKNHTGDSCFVSSAFPPQTH